MSKVMFQKESHGKTKPFFLSFNIELRLQIFVRLIYKQGPAPKPYMGLCFS